MSFLESQDISVIIARQKAIVSQIIADLQRRGRIDRPDSTQELKIEQATLSALLNLPGESENIPIQIQPEQNNNLRNALILGGLLLLI